MDFVRSQSRTLQDCETLQEFLDETGREKEDLLIRCRFCDNYMQVTDIERFLKSELRIKWRGIYCFGCCWPCLRFVAEGERVLFLVKKGLSLDVQQHTGKNIQEQTIRCLQCLKPLTSSEKLYQATRAIPFELVRSSWRGWCEHCLSSS